MYIVSQSAFVTNILIVETHVVCVTKTNFSVVCIVIVMWDISVGLKSSHSCNRFEAFTLKYFS
jgi:hypothetical protein